MTEDQFDLVFGLNTRGQFFVAREAYHHLKEVGRVIMMSSNTAKDFSMPRHSQYSDSKGAIASFMRVFSKDCSDKKITVDAFTPGRTVTDMFYNVSQHYIPNGETYSAEEHQQASHRLQILLWNDGLAAKILNALDDGSRITTAP